MTRPACSPVVQRHRAKVRLDPGSGSRAPLVAVTLTDGSRFKRGRNRGAGTMNNPMTRDQVIEKCRGLVSPVLGLLAARKLIDTALNIDNLKDVRELRPLLQRG